jgi:hypothetical protein
MKGGVSLEKLPSTAEEFKKNGARKSILALSLSKKEIIEAARNRKEPILTEITELKEKLAQFNVDLDRLPSTMTVTQLAEALVKYRKKWIHKMQSEDIDISSSLAKMQEDVSILDAYSDPEFRQQELQIGFFQLNDPDIISEFRGNITLGI